MELLTKIKFEPAAFFISFALYPLDWELNAYYVMDVLHIGLGPLSLEIGNPFWLERYDENGEVILLDDYRGEER